MIIDVNFAETNTVVDFTLSEDTAVDFSFAENSANLSAVFEEVHSAYDGAYEVDPDFVGSTLACGNRYMTRDVTVNPIQVESVSNQGGGRTVYIGGIV